MLHDHLRFAVRTHWGEWEAFGDGHFGGLAVYCCRGGEDKPPDTCAIHSREERDGAACVVVKVEFRLFGGFAHADVGGEANYSIEAPVGKEVRERFAVCQCDLVELFAGDAMLVAAVDVIDNRKHVPAPR